MFDKLSSVDAYHAEHILWEKEQFSNTNCSNNVVTKIFAQVPSENEMANEDHTGQNENTAIDIEKT